ncbi:MAG: DUF5063 domain-containing protein [Kiloniellaceae bacterium]
MIAAVREFLRLFEEATPDEERTPERLSERLDRLLVAYHESPDFAPQSHVLAPSRDFRDDRRLMEARFPDFGYYAWCEPGELLSDDVMVGDAIDDLADIYSELRGVMWLLENSSQSDAVWHFRFGYRTHWGRHLLDLRSYLHWKLHEAP